MNAVRRGPLGASFFAGAALVMGIAAGASGSARAQPAGTSHDWLGDGHWRIVGSPFSQHWRPSDEHRHVYAIGVERQRHDDWLAGASYFSNSFGQPSAYLYVGKRWNRLFGHDELFGQASAGLMYGYRGKYEDKVPLNNNGFSPGAVVSAGWQFNRQWAVTAHLLGDAAIMFQLSYDLR